MKENGFNPQRLILARQKRGLTKIKLAAIAGVTTRSLTGYEAGETIPTYDTIASLSSALKFPSSFFYAADFEQPNKEGTSFRALSSLTAAQRDSALAAGAIAMELSDWIDQRFSLPSCNLLDLRDYSPDTAAAEIRVRWGIGERPIANSIHLLEANGVRVFSLVEACRQVDAFSFWKGKTPFVFLNTIKSGERSRFDAMHELGHLVLHRHGGPGGRLAEQEADAFASAMLMPRNDVLAHAPKNPTLGTLIEAKRRWTVAVSALNHRMHHLGLISDWNYRTFCIQIAESGFRVSEPSPCQRETSQLIQKVLSTLKNEGVTRYDIASELCVSLEDLDSLIFGLVSFSSITGGGGTARTVKTKLHLRLVK